MIPFDKQIGSILNGFVHEVRYVTRHCNEYEVYARNHDWNAPVMVKFIAFPKTQVIQLVGLEDDVEIGRPITISQLNLILTVLLQ